MKQFEKFERKYPCRDGPKLEMCNSTRIDRYGNPTATATSSNSIARFAVSESDVIVVLATAGTRDGFSENVRSGCSTDNTLLRGEQSPRSTSPSQCPILAQQNGRTKPRKDRPGRNVMTLISTTDDQGSVTNRLSILNSQLVELIAFFLLTSTKVSSSLVLKKK